MKLKKKCFLKNLCADFRPCLGISEALWGHAPGEKAKDQSKILDLGSQNSVLQHDMCPILFFKNHSTLFYRYTGIPSLPFFYTLYSFLLYTLATFLHPLVLYKTPSRSFSLPFFHIIVFPFTLHSFFSLSSALSFSLHSSLLFCSFHFTLSFSLHSSLSSTLHIVFPFFPLPNYSICSPFLWLNQLFYSGFVTFPSFT